MTHRVPEVVITGVGPASPIGMGRSAFWESLCHGHSGIAPMSIMDTGTLPLPYAGQLIDFDAKNYVRPRKAIKMMCREVQVGQAAAWLAMEDAGISAGEPDPDRFGIVFGSEMLYGHPIGLQEVFLTSREGGEISFTKWGETFTHEMFPLWLLLYLPNMVACHAAIALDARGPNNTIVQGAASGTLAVIEAATYIQRGWADVMLAGGCGTTISPTQQVYLNHANRSKNPEGERASRPFDADRDGWVSAEGGAAFVLESREGAEQRGARILATVEGMGRTMGRSDASMGGATHGAIQRSIQAAMAGQPPVLASGHALQHVVANGLATVEDDRRESRAIADLLADVPVTAPKSYFGHAGAGASAVELVVSVLALQEGTVPATLNYRRPDPECPVNVVHTDPLVSDNRRALAISQSISGQAAAILLKAER